MFTRSAGHTDTHTDKLALLTERNKTFKGSGVWNLFRAILEDPTAVFFGGFEIHPLNALVATDALFVRPYTVV